MGDGQDEGYVVGWVGDGWERPLLVTLETTESAGEWRQEATGSVHVSTHKFTPRLYILRRTVRAREMTNMSNVTFDTSSLGIQ